MEIKKVENVKRSLTNVAPVFDGNLLAVAGKQ
jgi:hypothetical protein